MPSLIAVFLFTLAQSYGFVTMPCNRANYHGQTVYIYSKTQRLFRFKQFTVMHDKCAMKVNTDGVLLGAWAEVRNVGNALDVGTGSGVIALMLAQRGVAMVEAVEMETAAAQQASENFSQSPWPDKLRAHALPLHDYQPQQPFDLIISNPPYFEKSYKTPDGLRNLARHNDSLPLNDLTGFAQNWLSPEGRLALILPVEMTEAVLQSAKLHGLSPRRRCQVRGRVGGAIKRVLWEFMKHPNEVTETDLAIETAPLIYTDDYKRLAKDFYLAF